MNSRKDFHLDQHDLKVKKKDFRNDTDIAESPWKQNGVSLQALRQCDGALVGHWEWGGY